MKIPDPDDSRRQFILGVSASALAAGCGISVAATQAKSAPSSALLELSAVEAVHAMSTGELSCERYAGALLERCAQTKALNAFIALDPARVLEHARDADRRRAGGAPCGALHGLPIPVKDSVNTAEYRTTAGTPALRDFQPAADAPLVATLRAAGAIVLGKTNLHELSLGWTSNNLAFGAVHNPYDSTRIAGGSSGGTAAVVAARAAPLGIAEDTEGSIRVPAALCGITGFRPSTRRYSTVGVVPCSPLFDQIGPHARCMADVALFDRAATGDMRAIDPAPLAGVRLAVARKYWFAGLDPAVERITEDAVAKLRAAGAIIVEAEVPDLKALVDPTTDPIIYHDMRAHLATYLATYASGISVEDLIAQSSTDVRAIFKDMLPGGAYFVTEPDYEAALKVRLPRLIETYAAYFAKTGAAAMMFPTTLVTAPRIGDETTLTVRGRPVPFEVAVGRNITPGSSAGLPGLVIPAGIAPDGLPVTLEFDGPAGSDRGLIALGMSIEKVLGHIPPPRLL